MSTNSINQFSVEDDGSVTESPPQSTKKCTRTTPCSQPDCNGCSVTASNGHIRDLSDNLEVTTTTPTTPPNHWIIRMIKVFEEAIQDQDPTELKMAQTLYKKQLDAITLDDHDYDQTVVKQLNCDATKLLDTLLANSIRTPNPTPPLMHLQTA